jgi:hypothetical protein
MHPQVVDLVHPVRECLVQLVQVGHLVAGRVTVAAGDLDQELLADRSQGAFYLAPSHRPARRRVGDLDRQPGAGPQQRLVDERGSVVGVQDFGGSVMAHRVAEHAAEAHRVLAVGEAVPDQQP